MCMYICVCIDIICLILGMSVYLLSTLYLIQSQCAPSFHRPSSPHKPTSDNSAANTDIVIQGSNNEHAYLHANRVAAILREGFFVEPASLGQWSPSTLVSLHVHKIISSE